MTRKDVRQLRGKNVVLSPREIENFIADGKHIFILDNQVIKADTWLNYHPGGLKAIQHMVGRDATDEVTAYVSPLDTHPHYWQDEGSIQEMPG